MTVPRPLTPLVRFLAGVSYLPGGALFLVRNPRLWPVSVSPLFVAAVFLMVGVFSGAFWAGRIEQSLFGGALRTLPVWLGFVIVAGLWIGSLAAGGILALTLAFVLLGPLFEKLSQKVEELSGMPVQGSKGLRWEIVQSLKTAAYFALGAPLAIVLGLIPFLGPALALIVTGHNVAFQNTDAVLLRRGMVFRERRGFHQRFRPETLGFGIAAVLLFPLMNVLAVPILVVGATRLVNDLEAVRDRPVDQIEAAVGVAEETVPRPPDA
ncbi:MAG: EI24 domain-containing protein [Vicinamibacteria bacterium]|nr:EI24 domain-containing protein [Vicinamibacteria bacterium]